METVSELDLNEQERDRYLEMMSVQTGRMKTLVEDLLTLAKLEGNPEPPISQVVNMPNMLARLKLDAEGLSQGKHQISFDQNSDKNILGDDLELYSAFSNLVSNAVRYTPEGGKVCVTWVQIGEEIELCVSDTGPGIAAEHIPRLTERFYRCNGRSDCRSSC